VFNAHWLIVWQKYQSERFRVRQKPNSNLIEKERNAELVLNRTRSSACEKNDFMRTRGKAIKKLPASIITYKGISTNYTYIVQYTGSTFIRQVDLSTVPKVQIQLGMNADHKIYSL
jgi:hypothetical protein